MKSRSRMFSRSTAVIMSLVLLAAVAYLTSGIPTRIHRPGIDRPSPALPLTEHPAGGVSEDTRQQISEAYGNLPLYFIENRGQVDPRVAYYLQGRDTTVYFTTEGLTFVLAGTPTSGSAPAVPIQMADFQKTRSGLGSRREALRQPWVLKLDFVGADSAVRPAGRDRTPAVISYFSGPRDHWKAGLPTYATVVYPDVWPGIDLVYTGTVNRLKYTFVIRPGADPSRIKMAYRGATALRLTESGALEVSTPVQVLHDDKPSAYQQVDGRRVQVVTTYAVDPETIAGALVYGFRIGQYDNRQPLVLDPAVLVYAGYIGGAGDDSGSGIAVDSSGNAYVTGGTRSAEATFPVTAGPDLTYNGRFDAFVTKVNPAGTGLIYAGYIGGTGDDFGYDIVVDPSGNAYISGSTNSIHSFPVTVGPDLTYNGGPEDAFVAKVNAAGTGLIFAGYIGGADFDIGLGIAVDRAGNAYVAGQTNSTEVTFPGTVGPDLTHNGSSDAFVAKVNATGTGLIYAGYIGGADYELGRGIAVDSSGNAHITGTTFSTENSFPVTGGPDLTHNGGDDAFVAKVNASGTGLIYAGYVGGAGTDAGLDIVVDRAASAYVTGATFSTEDSFPVTIGPDLTHNGGNDAFVAKVNAAGTGLVYAGYIGGSNGDGGLGIAVDRAGSAYVTGQTDSTEATFPVTVGPDLTYNGGNFDAFVAKVNAAGSGLIYAGYVGGAHLDLGRGIAVDRGGSAYVIGVTTSTEATFPVTVGPDLTHNGGLEDAFVAKVSGSR